MEHGPTQNQPLPAEQLLRILSMNGQELGDCIRGELIENPVLILDDLHEDSRNELRRRKLDWLERAQERAEILFDEGDDCPEPDETVRAGESETLADHLLHQLHETRADAKLHHAVHVLVGCLDDNGYFSSSRETLRLSSGLSDDDFAAGLGMIRAMDPPGAGAFSLRECLLMQLPARDRLSRDILAGPLENIAKSRVDLIAETVGAPAAAVREALARIRALDPKPGAAFSPPQYTAYVTPDVVITKFQGRFEVMVCDFSYPLLQISPEYIHMLKETVDVQTAEYLRAHIAAARTLADCIEARRKTLLCVVAAIVQHREAFFRTGKDTQEPLRREHIARELSLESVQLDCAIRGKTLQCPHGTFPLERFFA